MTKISVFEKYTAEYEEWFEKNSFIYQSELNAVKTFVPENRHGIEIGVGTGRFASPLNIKVGVEPSKKLAAIAREKGITVFEDFAERLSFNDCEFDLVLMVNVICFLDNIEKAFKESFRILKKGGFFIVCFIDKNSSLGEKYQQKKDRSRFYKEARFYSVREVLDYLKKTGFGNFEFKQTIFEGDDDKLQPVKRGYGEGSFVIIKALKNDRI